MRKKKNKKALAKHAVSGVKKMYEAEGKKSEEKKAQKKNKPKGMKARRLGMFTFWVLFSFMFLVTTVTIFSSGSDGVEGVEEEERNKLYDSEAIEFAKDFVLEYFTWDTDRHGKDMRIHNLEPYFLRNVDSMGGIIHDNEWSSSIDKKDIVFLDVQEIDNNKARFILRATFTLRSETDEEPEEENNLSFDEIIEQQNEIQISNGYKTKETTRYISVPIHYNHELDRFAVFDLPSFTHVDESPLEQRISQPYTNLKSVTDSYVRNNLEAFMDTFFETFARDGEDTISYILEDERHQNGLRGTMEFVDVADSTIYHVDDNNNKFIADTNVTFRDLNTEFEFTHKYLLVIKRENQRYVVESLNDEQAVYALAREVLEESDDEDSEDEKDAENGGVDEINNGEDEG